MKVYGGIDLHSNNSVIVLLDEQDKVVYRRRLANDLQLVLEELEPHRGAIEGLVVESTYNWYWLVDGLMAAGYPMHAILRSIELSPVRARMVEAPGDYPWSSYRANALGHADPVVSPHSLYAALADSDEGRRCAYRTLFADSLSETVLSAIREATNGGFVLGSGRFERQIAIMVGRRTWRGQSGRLKKQSANSDQLDLPI